MKCLPTGPPGGAPLPYPIEIDDMMRRRLTGSPLEAAPAGRYEPWTFHHQFVFTEDLSSGFQAIEVQQHIFEIGQQSSFIWKGIQAWANNPGAPEVDAAAVDPVANVRVAFFTHQGTRPLQNTRVRASLYRGAGLDGSSDTSFAIPFMFAEPMLVPARDTIRVDLEHRRPATTTVSLALLGYRWYLGK